MALLDTLIQIQIGLSASPVPVASFSIPLIIGPTSPTTGGIIQAYTDPAAMLTNGYTTSSPEYVYAEKLVSQQVSPSEFYVGKRSAAVAQVDTIAVSTLATGHAYAFTLAGSVISYTSQSGDLQQDVLTDLLAAIATAFPSNSPVTGVVSGSGSGALLTLTSVAPGAGFSISAVDADLAHVALTVNHGLADDLAAFIAIDNSWYGIVLCSNADQDILQLAAAVEPLKKIFFAASGDSAIPTSSTTDLLSKLKAFSYKRTALFYSPVSYNLGAEAAWMGGMLPLTPGSNNWAYQTLEGIPVDSPSTGLTDGKILLLIGNQVAQVPGKNGNCYAVVGGVDCTLMGIMVGGQYIDITIGIDWLEANQQNAIFTQAVRGVLDQGVVNGLINGDDPITVSAPLVATVPVNQRAGRLAPPINFECTLAGAIDSAKVKGTVSV
jgi:hypothetical protein